mgnify:CR=1 FL=1
MAKNVKKLRNIWFITYDNSELIEKAYSELRQEKFFLRYTVAGEKKGQEIAIYKDELKNYISISEFL